MKTKIFNIITSGFKQLNDLLITLFVFAVVSGLLFNDIFGVINTISILLKSIGNNGMAGLISLLVITLWYRR